MKPFRLFFKIILVSVILALTGGALFFRLRPPFLIVTDPSISLLYGAERTRLKHIELSIKFFRRVMFVFVSESAAPEIVAAAVESVYAAPGAVLFPELYNEGARRYHAQNPETPVIILESRRFNLSDSTQESEGLYFIRPDTETDLFKAGISAAFLADNSRILVIYDRILAPEFRAAFENGLKTMGFFGDVDYIEAQNEHIVWENYSCAVLLGTAAYFLEQNNRIPAILFSWINPEITPVNIKVIFNDSPWILAGKAPDTIKNKGIFPDTEIIIPRGRISEGAALLRRQLRRTQSIGNGLGDL